MHTKKELETLRHSAAHLLAQAVLELYPSTLLTIGPATQEGFFYDFLPEKNFKEEDLPLLEAKMLELAEKNYPITHKEISKKEARKIFAGNKFKEELIDLIPGDTVGLSEQGPFKDLCKGGHVASTGQLKHIKLLGISGSYWRADKNKDQLQRISGTAFFTQQELEDYLKHKEEAAQYDHRRLGKMLDLFSFHQEGPGFPFFHPKGKLVINLLIAYLRTLQTKLGYQEIETPLLLTDQLWRQSGHYDHYKDNMYFLDIEGEPFALKPMNCPGAFVLYNERPHSYRELPLRLAEFGKVHRHELSGVLHGLMRVRSFTIDDAHLICTLDQLEQEIKNTIQLAYEVYKHFGFEKIKVALSTKPENAMGSDKEWQKAQQALKNALDASNIPYTIQEGEGAFYGPKIEFKILDSMGREWQCGTIQVDFFLPERFNLEYVASSGKKERPVVVHRAIYGSLERFLAIILEHFKGKLPFWLAPVQVKILTITDDQKPYAQAVLDFLHQHNVRAIMDESSDQISAKIKTAQLEYVPWMVVIGKKEQENNTVTIRYLDGKQEFGLSLEELLAKLEKNR
ncbi:MAG: threonine--tRNA ligase [Candidatus Babeliales bacterium]